MDREKCINAGIDYDQGVNRFMGNKELYEKYALKFLDELHAFKTNALGRKSHHEFIISLLGGTFFTRTQRLEVVFIFTTNEVRKEPNFRVY